MSSERVSLNGALPKISQMLKRHKRETLWAMHESLIGNSLEPQWNLTEKRLPLVALLAKRTLRKTLRVDSHALTVYPHGIFLRYTLTVVRALLFSYFRMRFLRTRATRSISTQDSQDARRSQLLNSSEQLKV